MLNALCLKVVLHDSLVFCPAIRAYDEDLVTSYPFKVSLELLPAVENGGGVFVGNAIAPHVVRVMLDKDEEVLAAAE